MTQEAQRALYDQYFHYVYAVILRTVRDVGTHEDVEDLLVDTFEEVMRRYEDISPGSLKAYIGQTARHKALNFCRSANRHRANTVPLEDAPEPAAPHVEEDADQREMQSQLLDAIRALGEPDATILIQKYYYDRRTADIARMVGLSAAAVQMRCSRALKKLRSTLQDWR